MIESQNILQTVQTDLNRNIIAVIILVSIITMSSSVMIMFFNDDKGSKDLVVGDIFTLSDTFTQKLFSEDVFV